ncbi:MAG: glycosyltransferase [Rhodospirillales bacterium]|nr:glycosyltransferase [Rhodospirillales bacterium]MBO6787692.1 glycosyltransferase [Rhodospirillales bacterium]
MPRELAPVSVVIPAYNAEASIGRALESIAMQTLLPAEVIVVDDGSRDATVDAARAMQAGLEPARLVVITQSNGGAGAARNRAIAEATQPYLAFLDADDEWLPEKMARSMDIMRDGDFVLVAHDYLDRTPAGDVHVDCRRRFEEGDDPFLSLYLKGYIPSISVVTRSSAVIACGGFDETLRNAQDFDLWLKLLAAPGARFTLFGEALARYHHDAANSIMSHTERRIACCREIALRYVPALQQRHVPVLPAVCRRLFYVYLEAMRAKPAGSLGFGLRLIADAVAVSVRYGFGGAAMTPRFQTVAAVLSGLWIFGVLAGYAAQYRSYFGLILRALGLDGA